MPRVSPRRSAIRKKAVKAGMRSGLELLVATSLDERGVPYEYEKRVIRYTAPERRYIPDFELPNGVIIEVKGKFDGKDRAKHLLVRKQHPELDIRFLFPRDQRLSKRSNTVYSEWCEKHGFLYAIGEVPDEWLS